MISPELKKAGSKLVLVRVRRDSDDVPDWEHLKEQYTKVFEDISAGRVLSAYAVERAGIAEAVAKMAFGNRLGVRIEHSFDRRELFTPGWCSLVMEIPDGKVGELSCEYTELGVVEDTGCISWSNVSISLEDMEKAWTGTLEKVFPTKTGKVGGALDTPVFCAENVHFQPKGLAVPHVFIPVFPGTNCEFDSARAFEKAGATVTHRVFRNLNAQDILDSVEEYRKEIEKAQIIMFPGGFSAGDEPEGSAKFFATVFRNDVIRDEVMKLLNQRDGLMLGICNGFQALIKLGLVPYGDIRVQESSAPTLAMNGIGRHISRMVNLKVVSNKSPWLQEVKPGEIYANAASHGEGRFVAPQETIDRLFAAGQVAFQYCDPDGVPTMDEMWNPNGSWSAIEGILSADGRILGKMTHSERIGENVSINIPVQQDMHLFRSGVKYFA